MRAWIARNAALVKGFLEALDYTNYNGSEYPDEEDPFVEAADDQLLEINGSKLSAEISTSHETLEEDPMVDTISSSWSPQARKGLFSTPASQSYSLPTPSSSPPATFEWSPTARKGLSSQTVSSKSSKVLLPPSTKPMGAQSQNADPNTQDGFVKADLKLAYAIDHGTTNPDTTQRLAVPYPAPKDILMASRKMYADNVQRISQLKARNVPEEQRRLPWTVFEDDQIISYMLKVKDDVTIPKTEARFVEIARRMEQDGLHPRSKVSIKNMWCRVGRGRSGYDERKGVRRDSRFTVNKWKASDDSPKKRKKYNVKPKKEKLAVAQDDESLEV